LYPAHQVQKSIEEMWLLVCQKLEEVGLQLQVVWMQHMVGEGGFHLLDVACLFYL
jgi:hypothetical protein